jgi:hypothetical protein
MRLDCPRQKTGDERHSNRVPTLACQANIPDEMGDEPLAIGLLAQGLPKARDRRFHSTDRSPKFLDRSRPNNWRYTMMRHQYSVTSKRIAHGIRIPRHPALAKLPDHSIVTHFIQVGKRVNAGVQAALMELSRRKLACSRAGAPWRTNARRSRRARRGSLPPLTLQGRNCCTKRTRKGFFGSTARIRRSGPFYCAFGLSSYSRRLDAKIRFTCLVLAGVLLNLLLGTGVYLLDWMRNRMSGTSLDDLRARAHETYDTATDRASRATDVIRGTDHPIISSTVAALLGVGILSSREFIWILLHQ